MIPSTIGYLEKDFEIEKQSGKTYKMDPYTNVIRGYCDDVEAVKQAIYKILNTERYEYVIYSWNYGIELQDLFGEPVSYVCAELERRITEALMQDDRIQSVSDFEFDTAKRHLLVCTFIVHTIFGDMKTEKEVNY